MPEHLNTTPLWVRIVLVLACAAAVLAAVLVIGPASSGGQTSQRVVTAEKGVVQSTVSGSGNLQPATQVDVNFKASGTLTNLDVSAGQHVYQGELLAQIDPQSAEASVQQAQANLDSARAKLDQAQTSPSTSTSTSAAAAATANAADTSGPVAATEAISAPASTPQATAAALRLSRSPTMRTTTTTTTTTTVRTPAATKRKSNPSQIPSTSAAGARSSGASAAGAAAISTTRTQSAAAPTSTVSPAEQAANLASAQASVDSADLALTQSQSTLAATKLYAPTDGTVASIAAISPGDTVSAGGASGGSSNGSSSSGAAASGGGGTAGAGSATGGSSTGSSSSGSASGSAFIVIVNMHAMNLVVPFSESDIAKVQVGRPATVTVNALPNSEFAAHVTSIATLSTTNSGVVSYDVTFALDQLGSGLRPGMTASAQVVTSSAAGAVSVPSTAISRSGGQSTVTVLRNGKDVAEPVVTGVVGDSTTQIISGLSVGAQVVIRTATNLGSSSSTTGGVGARALGGFGAGAGLGGGGAGAGGLGGGGAGGGLARGGG